MAKKFLTGIDLANQRAQNAADASSPTDLVTLQQMNAATLGLAWKQPVRAATTTNGALATAYANGQSIDGVTLATNDRILIKDQTTQTENGVYTVNASGAPTRATDADSTAELNNATVFVMAGTVNADHAFTQTTDSPTIGSSNIVFAQFGGMITYTADGNALKLTGTQFAVSLDNTGNVTFTQSASGLKASVNPSTVPLKFQQLIGNGSLTSITVTHNLNTLDVITALREVSSGIQMNCDVTDATVNTITLGFAVAPTTNQYSAVVVG